ncbi:MAG: hypothetical protein LBN06_02475 [Prevotellaceae bacterium]|jgi:hypothetical protein|nr:hypothetical protein [Prevotellaceae bacterium]
MKQYNGIIKLLCLLVVAPIVIWLTTLKGTSELHSDHERLIQQSRQSSSARQFPAPSLADVASSEPLLSNGKILQVMAETLTTGQVNVVSYSPEEVRTEGESSLYLGALTLSGRYIELVKVLRDTEQMQLPLKIASVRFEYDRKQRHAAKVLTCRILLEQIEQH